VVIAAVAVWNVSLSSQRSSKLLDIALVNVEALAEEWLPEVVITCAIIAVLENSVITIGIIGFAHVNLMELHMLFVLNSREKMSGCFFEPDIFFKFLIR
jgi:hypothetical protein